MAQQADKPVKVSFMLPPSLHRRIRIAAAEEGVRLSALVAGILTEELDYRAEEKNPGDWAAQQRDPGDETGN